MPREERPLSPYDRTIHALRKSSVKNTGEVWEGMEHALKIDRSHASEFRDLSGPKRADILLETYRELVARKEKLNPRNAAARAYRNFDFAAQREFESAKAAPHAKLWSNALKRFKIRHKLRFLEEISKQVAKDRRRTSVY